MNKAPDDLTAAYNNKFRYGAGIDDRFMTICFDKDPFTEASMKDLASVYFIGVNTELSDQYTYKCRFATQVPVDSKVQITRRIKNAINQDTKNSLIRCEIPWDAISQLNKDSTEIVLDLIQIPLKPSATIEPYSELLREIRVPRLQALDQRKYTYVVQTMIRDMEDSRIVEWLVYNILLGVEHFYIYYNAHSVLHDPKLEQSQLKPFLEANLLTLVYFPFLHTVHFNNVQHAALNSYLHQFGRYTEYVGFCDYDEFFLPAKLRIPYYQNQPYTVPQLPAVIAEVGGTEETPGVIFDTLDMDCAPSIITATGDDTSSNSGSSSSSSVSTSVISRASQADTTSSASTNKTPLHTSTPTSTAVTTHCLRTGYLFREMTHGHGKMLVRPSKIPYIMSPHRLNHKLVEWADEQEGGMFRHFNHFRYTAEAISKGEFSKEKIGTDDALRNFTIESLKALVGITVI